MSDDLTGLPAVARAAVEGMRAAIRQKWIEATEGFFIRAITNRAVAIECQRAGFTDAAECFEKRAVWFVSQALYCLGRSGFVTNQRDARDAGNQ